MYLLNNGWIENMDKVGLPSDPIKDLRLHWLKPQKHKCDKPLYPDKLFGTVFIKKHLRKKWLNPVKRI